MAGNVAELSAGTIKEYLKRGQHLWLRAGYDLDIPLDAILPTQFLSWLSQLLPTLKSSSRRQYICSAREYLNALVITKADDPQFQADLGQAISIAEQLTASQFHDHHQSKPGTFEAIT